MEDGCRFVEDSRKAFARLEEVESEESIGSECEQGGVLDPSAWQDRTKWDGPREDSPENSFAGVGGVEGSCRLNFRTRNGVDRLDIPGNLAGSKPLRLVNEDNQEEEGGHGGALTDPGNACLADAVRNIVNLLRREVSCERGDFFCENGNRFEPTLGVPDAAADRSSDISREGEAATLQQVSGGREVATWQQEGETATWQQMSGRQSMKEGSLEGLGYQNSKGRKTTHRSYGDDKNSHSRCGSSGCGSKFFVSGGAWRHGGNKGMDVPVGEEEHEEESPVSENDTEIEYRWSVLRGMMVARHTDMDHVPAEVDKGLFLGSVGAAKNRQLLEKNGITHVLTVATHIQPAWPNIFKYSVIEVLDSLRVDLAAHFNQCFDFIDEAINSGGAILVHCFAGRSRSVTVVTAYLMRAKGLTLAEALSKVQRVRPEAGPNSGFMLQLRLWENRLVKEGVVVNELAKMTI